MITAAITLTCYIVTCRWHTLVYCYARMQTPIASTVESGCLEMHVILVCAVNSSSNLAVLTPGYAVQIQESIKLVCKHLFQMNHTVCVVAPTHDLAAVYAICMTCPRLQCTPADYIYTLALCNTAVNAVVYKRLNSYKHGYENNPSTR
jgi:hypothetical protein